MAITTVVVTFLVVGLMIPLGQTLFPNDSEGDAGPGLAAWVATALLGLYILGMSKLPRFIVSKILPRFISIGEDLSAIPRTYRRTCGLCEYVWNWDPLNSSENKHDPVYESASQSSSARNERTSTEAKPIARTKVPFKCPECGETSTYDPWRGPAICPNCGYTPTPGKLHRSTLKRVQLDAYQPYLQDFLGHSYGEGGTNALFDLSYGDASIESFHKYQDALGEEIHPTPGQYYATGYFRKHYPTRQEILHFLTAYSHVKSGEYDRARRALSEMTVNSPAFVEPWLWLAAVADKPTERIQYLERAYQLEPAHPLIRDVRSIVQGEVDVSIHRADEDADPQLEVQRCPQCGGALHYDPGAKEVECGHCGYQVILYPSDLVYQQAPSVSATRLQRKIRGQQWQELDRVLSCQACGAQLTMTEHLARSCAFCRSSNVLIEDCRIAFERPDGFLPFQLDKDIAEKAIQRNQPSVLWDFKGWRTFRRLTVQQLIGIFIPFWVFDGVVDPIWAWMRQDGTLTKAKGPGNPFTIENLMLPGTNRPSPSMVDGLSDYDLSMLVEYKPQLLADWSAMLYNIDVEIAVEDAYDIMISLALNALGPPVLLGVDLPPGTRAVRTLQVRRTTYQLILLPMWLAYLEAEGAVGFALVNGQNGDSRFKMAYRY
jgi:predicted RNA-binding Zn-ribbon protein involved in translation (DUF1610 family)